MRSKDSNASEQKVPVVVFVSGGAWYSFPTIRHSLPYTVSHDVCCNRTIGYKGWGGLMGRIIMQHGTSHHESHQQHHHALCYPSLLLLVLGTGIMFVCVDYRNFPQGTMSCMLGTFSLSLHNIFV
jgi:acetyl esterase/lipase